MKKKYIYLSLIASAVFLLPSCDDYLDTAPNKDKESLQTPEDIRKILVSAYADISPIATIETMSDNVDMNIGNYTEYMQQQRQAYEWKEIIDISGNDNLNNVWSSHYKVISAANLALEAIENLGNPESLNPHKGEALITRAYAHFVLVTTFSKMYGASSATALGIPYMTSMETTVNPEYDRETVAKTYAKINEDIEAALPLINDALYKQNSIKYHFNTKAAYAFAARFNLYYRKYDKTIEYANVVLGKDPSTMLRNWESLGQTDGFEQIRGNEFVNPNYNTNLLNISTYTLWPRMYGLGSIDKIKYTHNETLGDSETTDAISPWGPPSLYHLRATRLVVPLMPLLKLPEFFEITDPVSQTGFIHMVQPVFNADETLLCRAEAYALSNNYGKSLEDLNTLLAAFCKSENSNGTKRIVLTQDTINSFYKDLPYYTPVYPTIKKELNPDFAYPAGSENLLHTILHLRRVVTMHEGLRWHDVNRYGIVIYRRAINRNETVAEKKIIVTDKLEINDPRRVVQLPSDVISAGLTPNPRK